MLGPGRLIFFVIVVVAIAAIVPAVAAVEDSFKDDQGQEHKDSIQTFHFATPPFIIDFGIARFSDEKETNRLPLCNCEHGTVPPSLSIIASATFFVNRK